MRDSHMTVVELPIMPFAPSQAFAGEDVRVVTARHFDDLAPHVEAWDRLARQAPQMIPSLMPGWVDAFLRHRLRRDEQWLCCFAYFANTLVGVLPVVIMPHPVFGLAKPLVRTPSDDFTPSGDVLLAPEHAAIAFRALTSRLRREVPGHLSLSMRCVRQSSPMMLALKDGVEGYVRFSGRRSKFSFLNVAGSFEGYLAGLGNMRRNLKRFRKKLESQGPVTVEVRRGTPAGEEFLPEFVALEASGWKGRNGTAMAGNHGAVAFYSTLAKNLGSEAGFEWYVIRIQDQVVAAQMCVRCGGSLMLAKIAFNESYADCRPGHLLTGEVLRDAFARADIVEVNHLSDADWEGYWRMSYDEYVDMQLVRQGVISGLFELPQAAARYAYQNFVRPRIPVRLKQAYRAYRRRGDRKPLRSAESRSVRSEKACDGDR
jgi:CelD/BcsL family acetyltransferase involved in cellulose biosynthesis